MNIIKQSLKIAASAILAGITIVWLHACASAPAKQSESSATPTVTAPVVASSAPDAATASQTQLELSLMSHVNAALLPKIKARLSSFAQHAKVGDKQVTIMNYALRLEPTGPTMSWEQTAHPGTIWLAAQAYALETGDFDVSLRKLSDRNYLPYNDLFHGHVDLELRIPEGFGGMPLIDLQQIASADWQTRIRQSILQVYRLEAGRAATSPSNVNYASPADSALNLDFFAFAKIDAEQELANPAGPLDKPCGCGHKSLVGIPQSSDKRVSVNGGCCYFTIATGFLMPGTYTSRYCCPCRAPTETSPGKVTCCWFNFTTNNTGTYAYPVSVPPGAGPCDQCPPGATAVPDLTMFKFNFTFNGGQCISKGSIQCDPPTSCNISQEGCNEAADAYAAWSGLTVLGNMPGSLQEDAIMCNT